MGCAGAHRSVALGPVSSWCRRNLVPDAEFGTLTGVGTGKLEDVLRYLNPIIAPSTVILAALPVPAACAAGVYVGGGRGTTAIEYNAQVISVSTFYQF